MSWGWIGVSLWAICLLIFVVCVLRAEDMDDE